MDYNNFIKQLPNQYENWGRDSIHPKTDKFDKMFEQVQGMTTVNVMQLLNFAVTFLEPNEVYCEVGSFQGSTLIGTLLNNPDCMAYAVDNFSVFDTNGENFAELQENLKSFHLEDQVFFCNQDFEEFFLDLKESAIEDKIGVYFYDGAHDYRSQLLALLLVKPFLADKALIIIDDTNRPDVQLANWDFIATHPQCQLLLDLPTQGNYDRTFWDDLQVFSWDVNHSSYCDSSTLKKAYKKLKNQSIKIIPNQSEQNIEVNYLETALKLHRQGKFKEAEVNYKIFLEQEPNHFEACLNLGLIYYTIEEYQKSLLLLSQAQNLKPDNANVYYGLGLVYEKNDNINDAVNAYKKAIKINPNLTDAYNNLGNIFYNRAQAQEAEIVYRHAIEANPNHFGGYLNLGNVMMARGYVDEAISSYRKAYELNPGLPDVKHNLKLARFRKQLQLPTIYETTEEIEQSRQQFLQALDNLIKSTSLVTAMDKQTALSSLRWRVSFTLACQTRNDLEPQIKYGKFLHKVMGANYPEWVKPKSMPSLEADGRIRVGYFSLCMRDHVVGRQSLGWLKYGDKKSFKNYCYYSNAYQVDELTQEYQQYSDEFYRLEEDLEVVCRQILADNLHILVFLDMEMHAYPKLLAGLRLAPIQCKAWGPPVTSGLPTIDYFLSSELMESENAQEHYSEKLVKLPNLGFSYPKPLLPNTIKSRSDFQLADDKFIYLSCQTLHKYLPQYDYIFSEIAKSVPQAQFIFLEYKSDDVTEIFRQRLSRVFTQFSLNYEDYCLILPRMEQSDYFNLLLLSDVFLDTFGWSGGYTTLEAITCNLPVVTCPGEFLRGRHSYGILRMLEVTDTIAQTEEEYIEIAVKLGLDNDWREDIVNQIKENQELIYNDKVCVAGLENFYKSVVQVGLNK